MRAWSLGALMLAPLPLLAGEFPPGASAGALARIALLPELGQAVLDGGRHEIRVHADVSNEFVADGACAEECVVLDGETARLRLGYRRGFGGGWDLGAELSLLDQGGGFLDGSIEQWHSWFGLPDGGRPDAPRDRYRYRYERAGAALLDVTEPYSGFGDVQLGVGKALGGGWALRAAAKLPTGDDAHLGGGNAGGALWLETVFALGPARAFAAAGAGVNERSSTLPRMQNRAVGFGGLGVSAPLTPRLRLIAQVQAHTPLYDDSALPALTRWGVPLTLSLRARTGRATWLDIGFQEDLSVDATPDFAAYLGITTATPRLGARR